MKVPAGARETKSPDRAAIHPPFSSIEEFDG